ncbi:hypothetical protein PMAYCL1PPCAC_20722, partial [Pristionchus mayeri]
DSNKPQLAKSGEREVEPVISPEVIKWRLREIELLEKLTNRKINLSHCKKGRINGSQISSILQPQEQNYDRKHMNFRKSWK